MSTGYHNNSSPSLGIQASRIAQLALLDEKIFHASDLANLWQIQDKNTLYTTLKRYSQSGLIHRVYKGLYALLPVSKLDPFELGAKIANSYTYASTETVLYESGYTSQKPMIVTFVASSSKQISISENQYKYRKLQDKYLFNSVEIQQKGKVFFATPQRAIVDMLYFNPLFHFDREPDWKTIQKLQQEMGYPLTHHRYDFTSSN